VALREARHGAVREGAEGKETADERQRPGTGTKVAAAVGIEAEEVQGGEDEDQAAWGVQEEELHVHGGRVTTSSVIGLVTRGVRSNAMHIRLYYIYRARA